MEKKVRYPEPDEVWLLLGESIFHDGEKWNPAEGTIIKVFDMSGKSMFHLWYDRNELGAQLHDSGGSFPIADDCWAEHYRDGKLTYIGEL